MLLNLNANSVEVGSTLKFTAAANLNEVRNKMMNFIVVFL